ncbi:MAG: hypothetical protein LBT42_04555 [Tannerella sp.]|jgi:hypothetical protein|nr:hypothetical protein [Tannerella sp.]
MNKKFLIAFWGVFTAVMVYFNVVNNIGLNKFAKGVYSQVPDSGSIDMYVALHSVNLSSEIARSYAENKEVILILLNTDFPKLVYRYQEGICGPCFQEDMKLLYQLKDEIGGDRILIIPAYDENRNSLLSMDSQLNHFKHRNIPLDLLALPADEEGVISKYFAIINKDGNIEKILLSYPGYPEFTREYINEVKKLIAPSE